MSAYVDFGTALYGFMSNMDITSVVADGWAYTFNRPAKSDERPEYPTLEVMPLRDAPEALDNFTDDDVITYSVFISFSWWEATTNEESIRELVDLVRSELRKERRKVNPLGGSYTLSFSGEWGGNEGQTERFYRLDVTARIAEDIN